MPSREKLAFREPLVLMSLLTAGWLGQAFTVRAGDVSPTDQRPEEPHVAQTQDGPEALKDSARITIETNSSPIVVSTNGPPPKADSFSLKYSWEGWDGLHLELRHKTWLGYLDAATRKSLQATNLPALTNFLILHLEESKLAAKIGGKLALDVAAYVTGHQFEDFDNDVELRRARVYARGDCILVLPVSYEFELGYIPNQFYIENSYLSFKNLTLIGEFKVGQFQPPMSLDMVTSSRDISFMETASPVQALAPGTSAGIQIGQPVLDQRATWKLGLFTDGVTGDIGDASKDYGRAILRLTGLPLFDPHPNEPESNRLLHLGLSANILYSADSSVHYRSRPESHLAPYAIDTGSIDADGAVVAGFEAAWVNGPFSVQGEYLRSWVRETDGERPSFDGLYASASWFLTGESRPYNLADGCLDRVIPRHNLDGHGGWGAWEIVGRFSYANLNSEDIHGGRMGIFMAGVNWYLHSHLKWRFDYGYGHVADRSPSGNLNIFQTRMEVDF
jgi:phosphate-selective porin OprO/OprP